MSSCPQFTSLILLSLKELSQYEAHLCQRHLGVIQLLAQLLQGRRRLQRKSLTHGSVPLRVCTFLHVFHQMRKRVWVLRHSQLHTRISITHLPSVFNQALSSDPPWVKDVGIQENACQQWTLHVACWLIGKDGRAQDRNVIPSEAPCLCCHKEAGHKGNLS